MNNPEDSVQIQADLGHTVNLVSDHCNKASIAIESHKVFGFPVPIKIMFTLYYSLLSVQYNYVKKCTHLNFKKYFIAKKKCLSVIWPHRVATKLQFIKTIIYKKYKEDVAHIYNVILLSHKKKTKLNYL